MAAEGSGDNASFSMRMVIKSMKMKWPLVKNVKTGQLAEKIQNSPSKLVVLDARPEEEFEISHIEHAHRVDPGTADVEEVLRNVIHPRLNGVEGGTVVCYCSLGYRSSKYSDALQKRLAAEPQDGGSIGVYNLEGSLFKWANEGRPMVNREGQPVTVCHPYSAIWGKLLNPKCLHKAGENG